MGKYSFLSQRYYRFFKYLRTLDIIFFILYFIAAAYNTNNETMNIVCYCLMILSFVTLAEATLLYILHIIFKNK